MEQKNRLRDIPLELVFPNPDNPRIYFRQEELDNLLISINKYGIQVPISVYQDGEKYIIIDGERRWRTCKKLNQKTIPAIIQPKPTELGNLLMMFNIHSLREQWDLFTIANKITKVIDLLVTDIGRYPNEIELSQATGLNRSTIRRCKLLIELPQKYKEQIKKELEIPKGRQKLTEDFFIEMESSLKTVKRNYPEILYEIDDIRDNLIDKYKNGTIKNLLDFRKISKIATAHKNVSFSREDSENALSKIFHNSNSGIIEVFQESVGELYIERKVVSSITIIIEQINSLTDEEIFDSEIREQLLNLRTIIDKKLDGHE